MNGRTPWTWKTYVACAIGASVGVAIGVPIALALQGLIS